MSPKKDREFVVFGKRIPISKIPRTKRGGYGVKIIEFPSADVWDVHTVQSPVRSSPRKQAD